MFTQPVSMKCSKEQYEKDLKIPLLEMGYKEIDLTNWNIHPYLVTNYTGVKHEMSNLDDGACERHGRHFINRYNPELFLALAAMAEIKEAENWEIKEAEGGDFGGKGEWIVKNNRFEKLHRKTFFYNDWRKATKEELINKFTKKEEMEDLRELLHSGDIVELRNGNLGIVIDTRIGKLIQFKSSYTEVSNFDENLKAVPSVYDIIKIRRISLGMQILPIFWREAPVSWERKETKEMTLDELIKEAGYEKGEIKIKVE
jgi:hypothetical protein